MVGEENAESPLLQTFPARDLAWDIAWRRAADVFGALHVKPFHVLLGQDEILRAGFTEHLEAALLGAADFFHRFAVGDVDDYHGNVDQLRKRNGTMGGFTFDDDRPGCPVEMRRGNGLLAPGDR